MPETKILYLASYRKGGIEHFSRMLLGNLSDGYETDHFRTAKREGCSFAVRMIDFLRTIVTLVRKLNRQAYDVVHLNPPFNRNAILRDSVYLSITNAFGYGDRTIVFFHGWDREFADRVLGNRLYRWLIRRLYGRANVLFLFDAWSRDQLIAMGIEPQRVIITTTMYQRLDPEAESPDVQTDGKTHILFMSRLVEGKGVEIAARAAKLLVDRGRRDFKLTFAGDGPLLGWLQEFLAENEVGGCIEAYGYASGADKDRLLRGADIFLLPTQLPEGCPVAIIEAMGAGQAVVTTPRGAIPNLVTEGRNGLLRDSGDPKDFADAVTLLIDDRRLLATIQATNKREAEELYEVSRYSARMERVYDSIVQGQIGTLGSDGHPVLR